MYWLTRGRYDGMTEVKEVISVSPDKKDLEKTWVSLAHGYCAAYEDVNGLDWYLEIEEVLDDNAPDHVADQVGVKEVKKTEKIEIRVTDYQKILIKKKAEYYGLTVSAYLVMLAMKDQNN